MSPTSLRHRITRAVPAPVRRGVGSALRRYAERADPDPFSLLSSATSQELAIIERCMHHTMTSPARLLANMDAVEYVVRADIPGALAECGVYKGGSVLSMVLTLQRLGVRDRDVYLFDTFEGMTQPGEMDTSRFDEPALTIWQRARDAGERSWNQFFAPEEFNFETVAALMRSTGYPMERIHLVVGTVEETVPDQAPDQLAVLRLDTDWYESTKHEMEHLYPRLAVGGVLVIDDYGHWDGARRAVDEHFAERAAPIHLGRVDYTARVGIKR